ncbi:MAG: hypothetical protein JXA99_12505 [Candidatus Lokiarchaeota archaeon]|nr:hypothetical protein [Candidatus Lokiarchaeota archaeon]
MVKITYDNFRDVNCRYAKFIQKRRDTFLLPIIDFRVLKRILLKEYSEDDLEKIFAFFPSILDSEVSELDKAISTRLNIGFYEDFQLVEHERKEFVLVNIYSDFFENAPLMEKIMSQPIPFSKFVTISFDTFVELSTGNLIMDLEYIFKGGWKEENRKFSELRLKQGMFI